MPPAAHLFVKRWVQKLLFINKKLLWGSRGHVPRFYKKSPLAVGDKKANRFGGDT